MSSAGSNKTIDSYTDIMQKLKDLSDPVAVEEMARFGINPGNAFGVSITVLQKMAREIGRDHALAEKLWASAVREARVVACYVEQPEMVTEAQMERWAQDFNSWDICDVCCSYLLDKTEWAYAKAVEWTSRQEEFVKRAGFVLMAALSVHDKRASDEDFVKFLPFLVKGSSDDRNYVKKAVNWALRQIGKRNLALNKLAVETAQEIKQLNLRSARWIASDALRELTSQKVQTRLKNKKN